MTLKKELGDTSLPNLTDLATNEVQTYCLSLPQKTDIGLVLLMRCSKELLARDDLDLPLRSYAVSAYNHALLTLVTTDKQQTDSTNRVILNYPTSSNFTLSDKMRAIDSRLKPVIFGEVGIAIVTARENKKSGIDTYYPLEGIFQDATIVMTRVKKQGDSFEVSLNILMNNDVSTIKMGSNDYVLKHSPGSAYLALIEKANIDDFNWLGFVSPSQAEKRRGVFSIGAISDEKIPLIMLHGLNSDPLIWRYLTMALLNESELMSRYQIWHIYYPTGPPPFYTALRTRDNLRSMLREIDNPSLADNAVIVGHSMGGIITKLLAIKSNLSLWDATFNIPPEALLAGD
ncbi:MAG: alpha/beta hydrolase, partial [Psychromonas sp.]